MKNSEQEALVLASILEVLDVVSDAEVRMIIETFKEAMGKEDYTYACMYIGELRASLKLPLMPNISQSSTKVVEDTTSPAAPPPPSVRELAHVTRCRIDAPLNVVAEAALKRIAELKDENMACAEIIGTLNTSVMHVHNREHPRNKYDREILPKVHVDVYDVLNAFEVWKPEVAHAVKKLLTAGKRGDKSLLQDLQEAQASIEAAVRREEVNNVDPKRAE